MNILLAFSFLEITFNVFKSQQQKTSKILKKRAKNRRFSPTACLNGHASLKTGDLATLDHLRVAPHTRQGRGLFLRELHPWLRCQNAIGC